MWDAWLTEVLQSWICVGHGTSPNNRQVDNGDLLLLDLGCEYYCCMSHLPTFIPVRQGFLNLDWS